MIEKHPDSVRRGHTAAWVRGGAATVVLSSVFMGMTSITAQASTTFAGGNGSTADPFIITTPAQLETMASDMNSRTKDQLNTYYFAAAYQLGANIDLSGTTWTSIQDFAGVFNGNGYTISNLSGSNGLFAYAYTSSKIENVALTNVSINASGTQVGALVGLNEGEITNSYSSGSIVSSAGLVGGLVGQNLGTGSISYAHSTGSVKETAGNGYIGGLVGDNQGSIADSYSKASVSVSNNIQYIGGLVGYDNASASATNVYALGSVTANQAQYRSIGGLMGESDAPLTNAYAVGNVTAPAGNYVGGLLGVLYNTTIVNSFWDTTTTNQSKGVGSQSSSTVQLTAETDTNMKLASTFSSWPSVWNAANGSYPYFALQVGLTILPSGTEGSPYTAYVYPKYATGVAPYTWSVTGSLPPGLSLNSNGEIRGTPTTSGTYSFSVGVKDGLGATSTVSLSMDILPQAPTGVTHSSLTQIGWTEAWSSVPGATGYNVYIDGGKLTSSPVTGTSYNVTGETAGTTYNVTVKAVSTSGEGAASAIDSVTTLANALGVPTGTHSNVTQTGWVESWGPITGATSYDVYLNHKNVGNVTQTVYHFTGEQPGTTYMVQVSAVNGSGQSALSTVDSVTTASYGGGGPIPPTIIQDSFTEPAQVGQSYSATIHEIGGTDPMKWLVTSGSLPSGLSLDNQGDITGTPTTAGTYTFTVKVTDANNLSFSKQLTLTVNGTPSTGAGSTNSGGSSTPTPPATPVSVTTSNEQTARWYRLSIRWQLRTHRPTSQRPICPSGT